MKVTKLNSFNMNVALKILWLLGFSFFFINSIYSGSVNRYVHPRIIPYMFFAAGAMLVIAFLLFGELFKPQKEKANSLALLFYIIPLIMAVALPAQSFDSNTRTIGNVQIAGIEDKTIKSGEIENNPLSLQNGILVMESSNFYHSLNEVYGNLDKYVGTQIEVVGFVFKDNEDFKDNEFVPARLMMVCCAADMQPVGFLCRYDKASGLKSDSWVKVSGIIGKTNFEGQDVPFIEAESVIEAKKPNDDYIYPY